MKNQKVISFRAWDRAIKVMSRQEINPTLGRSEVTMELHSACRVVKGHRKLEIIKLYFSLVIACILGNTG